MVALLHLLNHCFLCGHMQVCFGTKLQNWMMKSCNIISFTAWRLQTELTIAASNGVTTPSESNIETVKEIAIIGCQYKKVYATCLDETNMLTTTKTKHKHFPYAMKYQYRVRWREKDRKDEKDVKITHLKTSPRNPLISVYKRKIKKQI